MKHNTIIALEKRNDKTGQPITKNVPIFAGITFAGTRIYYFTGYRIDAEKFNSDDQEARKNSTGTEGGRDVQYNIINSRLKAIKAALELFFQSRETASKSDITSLLDAICKKAKQETPAPDGVDFYTMFENFLHTGNATNERTRTVKSTINHWKRFEASKKIKISFDSVNIEILQNFEKYLFKTGIGQNTVHKNLAITRTFWNYAKKSLKDKMEIRSIFGKEGYTPPTEVYGTPIYITKEERDKLSDASLPSKRLQQVRDVFVFQCFIGARVGDLCKMTKANIQNNALSYIPRKTSDGKPVTVNVPLHPKALEILSRYDLPGGALLPFISDQRYNDYIKEIFEVVGLTRLVTRRNPVTGESEQVRICDIASSHLARRCFVGNLYGKVDRDIIGSMSGHVKGSKAFSRYHDIPPKLQQDAINLL
jgi:integrase